VSAPPLQSESSALPYPKRILLAIRRIIRSIDLYSHRLDVESGVTVPQLSCLLRIVEVGPLSLKTLADEVDLSASTLVGIIDRLEKKELVKRQRSTVDRRNVLISATKSRRNPGLGRPLAPAGPIARIARITARTGASCDRIVARADCGSDANSLS